MTNIVTLQTLVLSEAFPEFGGISHRDGPVQGLYTPEQALGPWACDGECATANRVGMLLSNFVNALDS